MKRLRLSKALTVPETTSIREACRRMAARKVDALLLTDSNALLCGILTDKVSYLLPHVSCRIIHRLHLHALALSPFKDIAIRVIAQELNLDETVASKVMTRNPTFVLSDTLAVEALQKMVQGRLKLKVYIAFSLAFPSFIYFYMKWLWYFC